MQVVCVNVDRFASVLKAEKCYRQLRTKDADEEEEVEALEVSRHGNPLPLLKASLLGSCGTY
jgi:hypothetical protein